MLHEKEGKMRIGMLSGTRLIKILMPNVKKGKIRLGMLSGVNLKGTLSVREENIYNGCMIG